VKQDVKGTCFCPPSAASWGPLALGKWDGDRRILPGGTGIVLAAPSSPRDALPLPVFQQCFTPSHFIPVATQQDRPHSRLPRSSFVVGTSSTTQKQLCALSSNM